MVAQEKPRLVVDENAPYAIPEQARFTDPAGRESEYIEAPDIAEIARGLIRAYADLNGLSGLTIAYYWKKTSGTSRKRPILGAMERPSARENFLEPSHYVLWLSASRCSDAKLTVKQVTALVFHQLMHAQINANGKPGLRGPDAEIFYAELQHFGPWNRSIARAGAIVRQSSFFDDVDGPEDEDDEPDDGGDENDG